MVPLPVLACPPSVPFPVPCSTCIAVARGGGERPFTAATFPHAKVLHHASLRPGSSPALHLSSLPPFSPPSLLPSFPPCVFLLLSFSPPPFFFYSTNFLLLLRLSHSLAFSLFPFSCLFPFFLPTYLLVLGPFAYPIIHP